MVAAVFLLLSQVFSHLFKVRRNTALAYIKKPLKLVITHVLRHSNQRTYFYVIFQMAEEKTACQHKAQSLVFHSILRDGMSKRPGD